MKLCTTRDEYSGKRCGKPAAYAGTGHLSFMFFCQDCAPCDMAHSFVPITEPPKKEEPAPIEIGVMRFQPTLLQRIGMKLFPRPHLEWPKIMRQVAPDADNIDVGKDGLYADIEIRFTWRDRVRLFLTGRALMQVRIAVENQMGEHIVNTCVSILPPNFLAIEKAKL